MSEFISSELRSAIWIRAANCCEYCLTHADDSYYPHEIDHILPKKHGGSSNYDNLALSCFFCNRLLNSLTQEAKSGMTILVWKEIKLLGYLPLGE